MPTIYVNAKSFLYNFGFGFFFKIGIKIVWIANPWARAAANPMKFRSVAGSVFGPGSEEKYSQKRKIKYPVLK